MLKKNSRIHKERFEEIISRGKTFHATYVYIRTLPSLDGVKKFSTVVPKKVAKKAHDRNLIKRRINHVLRLCNKSFSTKDYLVFAKNEIKNSEFSTLSADIEKIARNISAK